MLEGSLVLTCMHCILSADIVVDNCAICRNHIMDLCKFAWTLSCSGSHDVSFGQNMRGSGLLLEIDIESSNICSHVWRFYEQSSAWFSKLSRK